MSLLHPIYGTHKLFLQNYMGQPIRCLSRHPNPTKTILGHDQVWFWWDWDDGTNSGWVGPYNSGETACESHIWDAIGTYVIKVKAKDVYGAESDWAELTFTTPRNRATVNSWYQWFLERFPILQKMLLLQR